MSKPENKLPQNKLALLFLLDQLKHGGTPEQLSTIKGDYPFLNYFELHLALDDMLENGLIESRLTPSGEKSYSVSELGKTTLEHFRKEIPFSLRRKLAEEAKGLNKLIRTQSEYLAEYRKVDEGQYIAELRVVEMDIVLLEVRINLPTIEQAYTICDTWTQNAAIIYQMVLKPLDSESE